MSPIALFILIGVCAMFGTFMLALGYASLVAREPSRRPHA